MLKRFWAAPLFVFSAFVGLLTGCLGASGWDLSPYYTDVTPADPQLPQLCGAQVPVDPAAVQRGACQFSAGADVATTLGMTNAASAAIPIRHIIVVMKENRSFDHIFGTLHQNGQPEAEAIPADYQNLDLSGQAVKPYPAGSTCLGADPDHQWGANHIGMDFKAQSGRYAMDGFVASAAYSTGSDGHFVLSHYEPADLPFYFWLANTYALRDRHFAPLATGTYPNRDMFMLGTNGGVQSTTVGPGAYPPSDTPSIFAALHRAGFSWKIYSDGTPLSGTLGLSAGSGGVFGYQQFLSDLDAGTLPNVAFVDGVDGGAGENDDHPPADLQVGEAWLREIYVHAIKSPQWQRSALIWTYDEAGGFADHVPPPQACAASSSAADQAYRERGPRVPLVMVSPWAQHHFVSHATSDHVSITRFIEAIFGLTALTDRDANSDALLDMFDFSCTRDLSVPEPPAAGTGGCHPGRD